MYVVTRDYFTGELMVNGGTNETSLFLPRRLIPLHYTTDHAEATGFAAAQTEKISDLPPDEYHAFIRAAQAHWARYGWR